MTPTSRYTPVMGHEIHAMEWGDPALPTLVMWHGLARTGRDFDEVASALSDRYHVLCPDTIGRGLSTWSTAPEVEYRLSYYAELALAWLDALGLERVHWLGTSMGGLIGIHIASGPQARRLESFIINDIGPELPGPAARRIVTYAADLPVFRTLSEAEAWLREVYAPFGPAADPFWQRMAETSVRRRADGTLTLHYDPRIIDMLTVAPADLVLWDRFDRITVPTHVLGGTQSDILLPEILDRMQKSGPRPAATMFDDCGHAPSLARPGEADMVDGLIRGLSRAFP